MGNLGNLGNVGNTGHTVTIKPPMATEDDVLDQIFAGRICEIVLSAAEAHKRKRVRDTPWGTFLESLNEKAVTSDMMKAVAKMLYVETDQLCAKYQLSAVAGFCAYKAIRSALGVSPKSVFDPNTCDVIVIGNTGRRIGFASIGSLWMRRLDPNAATPARIDVIAFDGKMRHFAIGHDSSSRIVWGDYFACCIRDDHVAIVLFHMLPHAVNDHTKIDVQLHVEGPNGSIIIPADPVVHQSHIAYCWCVEGMPIGSSKAWFLL